VAVKSIRKAATSENRLGGIGVMNQAAYNRQSASDNASCVTGSRMKACIWRCISDGSMAAKSWAALAAPRIGVKAAGVAASVASARA